MGHVTATELLGDCIHELRDIRELCAGAGCSDPGGDCAGRTLVMVEELRQRVACAAHGGQSHDELEAAANRALEALLDLSTRTPDSREPFPPCDTRLNVRDGAWHRQESDPRNWNTP